MLSKVSTGEGERWGTSCPGPAWGVGYIHPFLVLWVGGGVDTLTRWFYRPHPRAWMKVDNASFCLRVQLLLIGVCVHFDYQNKWSLIKFLTVIQMPFWPCYPNTILEFMYLCTRSWAVFTMRSKSLATPKKTFSTWKVNVMHVGTNWLEFCIVEQCTTNVRICNDFFCTVANLQCHFGVNTTWDTFSHNVIVITQLFANLVVILSFGIDGVSQQKIEMCGRK